MNNFFLGGGRGPPPPLTGHAISPTYTDSIRIISSLLAVSAKDTRAIFPTNWRAVTFNDKKRLAIAEAITFRQWMPENRRYLKQLCE